MYDHDNDSEEMTYTTFLQHSKPVTSQADTLRAAAARVRPPPPSCNCTPGEHCYHPWAAPRFDFDPGKPTVAAAAELRRPDKGKYVPNSKASKPLPFEEMDWMSLLYFGNRLTQVQDFDGNQMPEVDVGLIITQASRIKHAKASAYVVLRSRSLFYRNLHALSQLADIDPR